MDRERSTHTRLPTGTSPEDPRNTTTDGLFPTERVVGGFDFVGEFWVGGDESPPLAPDPDPIDGEGHGTHVAHIAGGNNGVAPGVDLYAVKVCATQSTACSGVALLQAMDWVLDPDGNGDTRDRVDIVNMSLGSLYGQAFDDDLSLAVENASRAGILTVAAAGNGADKPYVLDTPGATPSALAVAQTNMPSAVLPVLQVLTPADIAGDYTAVFQPWSVAPTEPIEGPLQYGDGAGGNLLGCEPFPAGSLTGLIVLVDRGECNFTLKISNISQGGGLAGIIGLVAPGEPFAGADGGDRPIDIPGYMVSQDTSETFKSGLDEGVTILIDPAVGIPLVGTMVGSSSRGPAMRSIVAKPEIGAPGESVSAIAGTGSEEGPFGGTSGATPMVTGSAALLLDAFPHRTPMDLKNSLVNTAETEIFNGPTELGAGLAPIARIGGGEVRVDRAIEAAGAAWDADTRGALSFGLADVTSTKTITRQVLVRNFSDSATTYAVTPQFRFDNDAASAAVSVSAPGSVTVPARDQTLFDVTITIDGSALADWSADSGAGGADSGPITDLEYDGYLVMESSKGSLHLPWHVLPRKSGDVAVQKVGPDYSLTNNGVGTQTVEAYSLIASSEDLPEGGRGENSPTPDFRYLGYSTFPVARRVLQRRRFLRDGVRGQHLGAADPRQRPGLVLVRARHRPGRHRRLRCHQPGPHVLGA